MSSTKLVPTPVGSLSLDDLEQLAFRYGGTIERTRYGWQLVGAVIDGRSIPPIRGVR